MDRNTLRLAKRAGCAMLGFGLESINQRVLDFIDKGTKVEIIKRIIKDSHDLKLNIYCQTMIGLPSETVEEAFDTVFFLAKCREAMRISSAFNIYYLTPKNKIFLNPEKYGIKITYNKRLPFTFFYPFKHFSGNIERPKAQKIITAYDNIIGFLSLR